jgi:hypothetical protein
MKIIQLLSKTMNKNIQKENTIKDENVINNIRNIDTVFYKPCVKSKTRSKYNYINIETDKSSSNDMIKITNQISRIGDHIDNIVFKIDFNNYFNNNTNIYNYKQMEEFCYNLFTNITFNIVINYDDVLCNNNIIKINPTLFYNNNYVIWNKNYMIINFKQFIKNYIQILKIMFNTIKYEININLLNCRKQYMINNDMINNDMINNDMINNDMINNDMINNDMINNDMINNDMINMLLIDKFNNFIKNCTYYTEINYCFFDSDERKQFALDNVNYFLPINYYLCNNVEVKKGINKYEYNFNVNNILKYNNITHNENNDLLYILFSFSNKYNKLKNFDGTIDILINNNNILNNSMKTHINDTNSSILTKSSSFYKQEYLRFFNEKDSLSYNCKYNDITTLPMALNFQLHPELDYFTGCLNKTNIKHIESIKFTFNGEFLNLETFETELNLNVLLSFKYKLVMCEGCISISKDN